LPMTTSEPVLLSADILRVTELSNISTEPVL